MSSGRNCLALNKLHKVQQETLDQFNDVFTNQLGTILPFKAELLAKPVHCVLKSGVEGVLDPLDIDGVLERINSFLDTDQYPCTEDIFIILVGRLSQDYKQLSRIQKLKNMW